MMDPNIGWFQLEHKGPALDLWVKTWKDATGTDSKSSTTEEVKDCPKTGPQKVSLFLPQIVRDNPSSTYDLDNNLHLIAKYNGTPWLLSKDPVYEGIDGLHKEIEDFIDYIKPKPTERQIRLEVQQRITKCIENLWTDAVVECFGSFKTNTYLPTSDIDLVVINHRWCYLPLAELEHHFIITHQCSADKIRLLDRASVPIIKMTDCLTDIRINISFNMPQVVKSVNLVKDYIEENPNILKLLYVVKQFVLQRDLNEVFKGGLSSYSLVLMVVHFFKTVVNPKEKNQNLGRLLMRFLELYGRKVNYNVVGLKVKDGLFVKKSELMVNMDNGHDSRRPPSLLCIEDPLDERNNVSKNSYKFDKVRDAFAYAFYILDRVVGPTQVITGKSLTILGRIIRITDEVIINRENLFLSFNNYNYHLLSTFGHYIPLQQGRGTFRQNRGNRGNKRNNQNRNNYPSNNQKVVGHPTNETNGIHFDRNPNHKYNEFNGRGRNGNKRFDGHSGHHYWNHNPKFNHFHPNSICYYSFDRNANQQKVRALQLTEDKTNDKVRDKSEANGSTAGQEMDNSTPRARSGTVPQ